MNLRHILKSYYLVTLEIRLEDLDLRSLDIKIRNTDLLQEIISCKKIISICGLALRRKISKLGFHEKKVSKPVQKNPMENFRSLIKISANNH